MFSGLQEAVIIIILITVGYSCIQCLQEAVIIIILITAGYNYYGTERMFSGVNGQELEADIFIGVVYYQRLRHMVSDKFQVHNKLNSAGI